MRARHDVGRISQRIPTIELKQSSALPRYYLKWHPQSCYYYAVEHGGLRHRPSHAMNVQQVQHIDDRSHTITTDLIHFGMAGNVDRRSETGPETPGRASRSCGVTTRIPRSDSPTRSSVPRIPKESPPGLEMF